MSMYKKDFLIKDENFFDKYNEIWGKVNKINKKKLIKKLIETLYIIKKFFLKLKNKSTQKKAFIAFLNR